MDSNQVHEEGDTCLFASKMPDTPSPDSMPSKPKRIITPRGPLFPNLDEAHRRITSRLTPHKPFQKSSHDDQYSEDIPLQDLSRPLSTNGLDGNDTPGSLRRHASDFVAPRLSSFMAGRSLTDRQSSVKFFRSATVKEDGRMITADKTSPKAGEEKHEHHAASAEAQYPDTTGSTVSRIVDQYAKTGGDCMRPDVENSNHIYTFEPPTQRQGATTRLGFHDTKICAKPDEVGSE
jgi:hypothetical protein